MVKKRDRIGIKEKAGKKVFDAAQKVLENEKVPLAVTTLLSFLAVYFIISSVWPVKSGLELGYAMLIVIFSLFLIVAFTRAAVRFLFFSIAHACKPLAEKYDEVMAEGFVDNEVRQSSSKRSRVLGTGSEAEVSLRYFINREKKLSLYNAKYMGPV